MHREKEKKEGKDRAAVGGAADKHTDISFQGGHAVKQNCFALTL